MHSVFHTSEPHLFPAVFVWETWENRLQLFESNFTDLDTDLTQTTFIICHKQTSSLLLATLRLFCSVKENTGLFIIKTTLSRIISIPFSSSLSLLCSPLLSCPSYGSILIIKLVLLQICLVRRTMPWRQLVKSLVRPLSKYDNFKKFLSRLSRLSLFKSSFLLDSCAGIFTLLCILGREPHVVIVLFESCIHLRLVPDCCIWGTHYCWNVPDTAE